MNFTQYKVNFEEKIARILLILSEIVLLNVTKYLKSIEEVSKLLMKIVKILKWKE